MDNRDNLRVEGHRGTWYVVEECIYRGAPLFLLEHEEYGDEAANVVVTEDLSLILSDVYNSFDDVEDADWSDRLKQEMSKYMTTATVKEIALDYYTEGGDAIVECYDEEDLTNWINEARVYVAEHPETNLVDRLMSLFAINVQLYDECKREAQEATDLLIKKREEDLIDEGETPCL